MRAAFWRDYYNLRMIYYFNNLRTRCGLQNSGRLYWCARDGVFWLSPPY